MDPHGRQGGEDLRGTGKRGAMIGIYYTKNIYFLVKKEKKIKNKQNENNKTLQC